jgi:hypothetical protein
MTRGANDRKRQDFDAWLRSRLNAYYTWTAPSERNQTSHNAIIGESLLKQDLGVIGEWQNTYDLDEDIRDRLIAHARQDAAHAVLNTASLLDEVVVLRKRVRSLIFIGIAVLVFLFLILVCVWPRH